MLATPDAFEPDDTPAQAKSITVDGAPQQHSLHASTDIDWVRITLDSESDVFVQVTDQVGCQLYRGTDTKNPIGWSDWYTGILRGFALPSGTYLVRVYDSSVVDNYSISVSVTPPVPVLERADFVSLAGEGFNALKYTPDGRLAGLLWYGNTLIYRVRGVDGQFSEEVVRTIPQVFVHTQRDARHAQLLFTADATPHVLMSDDERSLTHYRRDEGGWTRIDDIPLDLWVGEWNYESIGHMAAAVGVGDTLHFVVAVGRGDDFSGRLLYGTNQGGVWRIEEAASQAADNVYARYRASNRRFVSIAVDADNAAHISYTPIFLDPVYGQWARPYSQLAYATNRTGSWTTQIVHQPPDDSGDSGAGASIALAPDGQPAIAQFYMDRVSTGSPSLARLQYHKRQANGTWATEIVASAPDGYVAGDGPQFTGFAPHLLFDPEGTPHIAFSDYAVQHFAQTGADQFAGQIRYAVKTGGVWQIVTVVPQSDPLHNQMIYPTMALRSNEIAFVGIRRQDFLDADLMPVRSDHYYVSATVPRRGLTVHAATLSLTENQATTLTVTRHNGNNAVPLTVLLTNGDTSELTLATQVTIPAGQPSVTTSVMARNDNVEDGTQTVAITAAAASYVTGRTIVNVQDDPYVQIYGAKFEDVDADGRCSATEPGLAGWTIFVDANRNGVWDESEPVTTTGADGSYAFNDLRAGSYSVVDMPRAGWGRTTPLSGSHEMTLAGGQAAHHVDFGGLAAGFDVPTGRLTLLTQGDDRLQVAYDAGSVTVERNGQPDSDLQGILAASVLSLVVLDGRGDNQLDLQGVMTAAFPNLAAVIVRESGNGTDVIEGSSFADTFYVSGSDTVRGHAGDDVFALRNFEWVVVDGGEGQDTLRLDGSSLHLDLSTIESSRTASIEAIDATGSGPNQLTLDVLSVCDLSADTDTLRVYADSDDEVHFVAAWVFEEPLFVDGWFFNRVVRDNATVWLHGPHAWQNPANPRDVNRDGFITPIDALLVINALNRGEPSQLPNPETSGQVPIQSYDVSGDDMLSPLDALLVINYLNRLEHGEGESNSVWTAPDVHYGGNAVGDSGNSPTDTVVNEVDALAWRCGPAVCCVTSSTRGRVADARRPRAWAP